MKRRRARENPIKTGTKIAIGVGGAAILGGLLYFVTRPKSTETSGSSASMSNGKGDGTTTTVTSGPKTSTLPAPPPPPANNISNAPPAAFAPAVNPNVSWVPGPKG